MAACAKAETPTPSFLVIGPLVVFGDSTTAPREKTKVYAESLAETFEDRGWKAEVVNAGMHPNNAGHDLVYNLLMSELLKSKIDSAK